MSGRRRSPQLSRLPRRELNAPDPEEVVKLRTSVHRRARDPIPRPFHQLTVPIDMAERIPPDARFTVTFDGTELRYRLVAP